MAVMSMLLTPMSGFIADRIGFCRLMICGLAMEAVVALGWLAATVAPTVSRALLSWLWCWPARGVRRCTG
jgi:MFS family permease